MAQAGEQLGRAVLELVVDNSKYNRDMKAAEGAAKDLDKTFEETSKRGVAGLAASLRSLGAVAGVVASGISILGGAIVALAKQAANYADEIGKAAQATGVSTETLSAWRHGANMAGVSAQELDTALQRLSRAAVEAARGNKDAERAFRELGISIRSQDGTIKKTDALLGDLAERFASMPDGAIKTALAMDVLGRSGAKLLPMFNQGREGIKAFTDEADRLNMIVTAEMAQRAEQFNDNISRLEKSAKGLGFAIGNFLIPPALELLDILGKLGGVRLEGSVGRQLERQIAALTRLRDLARPGTSGFAFYAQEIEKAQKALDELRASEEKARAGARAGKDPALITTGADKRKQEIAALTNSIKSLNEQLTAQMVEVQGGERAAVLHKVAMLEQQAAALGVSAALAPQIEIFKALALGISEATREAEKHSAIVKMLDQDYAELGRAAEETGQMLQKQQDEQTKKAAEALKKLKDEFDALIESAKTPAQRMADQMSRLHQLLAAEQITMEQYQQGQKILKDRLDENKSAIERLQDALLNLGQSAGEAFGEAIARGEDFNGVLRGLLRDLAAVAKQLLLTQFRFPTQAAASSPGGGGGFDIGNIFSGLAGGVGKLFGFAEGGIVPGPIGAPQLAVVHGGEEITSYEDRGKGGADMWDVKIMGDIIPRSDFATKDDVVRISKRAVRDDILSADGQVRQALKKDQNRVRRSTR